MKTGPMVVATLGDWPYRESDNSDRGPSGEWWRVTRYEVR